MFWWVKALKFFYKLVPYQLELHTKHLSGTKSIIFSRFSFWIYFSCSFATQTFLRKIAIAHWNTSTYCNFKLALLHHLIIYYSNRSHLPCISSCYFSLYYPSLMEALLVILFSCPVKIALHHWYGPLTLWGSNALWPHQAARFVCCCRFA